jgi:hypothetical protein
LKALTENEKKAQRLILTEIDKAMDLLENHLQRYCDEVAPQFTGQKSTVVPMAYIKESIKIIKENMKKGAGL